MKTEQKLDTIQERLQQLAFHCPIHPTTHAIPAPVYALLCMPMHYVAFAIMLKSDQEDSESIIEDLFGIKNIRESFAIGDELQELPVTRQDATVLRKLLVHRRPVDSIIYGFAIETLRLYFEVANEDVVELAKTIVARTTVSVAQASGDGWFGSGAQATPEQNQVIDLIAVQLDLGASPTAAAILNQLEKIPSDRHRLS